MIRSREHMSQAIIDSVNRSNSVFYGAIDRNQICCLLNGIIMAFVVSIYNGVYSFLVYAIMAVFHIAVFRLARSIQDAYVETSKRLETIVASSKYHSNDHDLVKNRDRYPHLLSELLSFYLCGVIVGALTISVLK